MFAAEFDLEMVSTSQPVLSLELAKMHLRIEDVGGDEDYQAQVDAELQDMIDAVQQYVDGPDGVLGRALLAQSWKLYLDAWPRDNQGGGRLAPTIQIPLRPLRAITSIAYIDPAGSAQTLDPSAYQVLDGERAAICAAYGAGFPLVRRQPRAITITFSAGYDAAPRPIVSAMKLMLGDLYVNRETQLAAASRAALIENKTAGRLLAPYCTKFI